MVYRNDNRGGQGGGGAHYNRGNRGGYGSRDQNGDRPMFQTRCANCGRDCEVPFKPTGSKPVYCGDCFRTMGGRDENMRDDRGPRRSYGEDRPQQQTPQPQYREQFATLNAKLDKILNLLSKEKKPKQEVVDEVRFVDDVVNQDEHDGDDDTSINLE